MIKTVKAGKVTMKLSNNLSWALIYKNQFGHDIIPDVMPIISAVSKLIGEVVGKDISEVLSNIDGDVFRDAMIELCAFQFEDFIHLVWAFNKAADDEVADPVEWARQFDEFPIDILAPAVFELLTKGLISTKNLKSLREMTTTPKAQQ